MPTETPVAEREAERPASSTTPRIAADRPAALFEVMSTARAIRHLAPEPVPEDSIRALIQAAVWAPTGSNQQGHAYVVVTDRERIARLAALWRRVVEDFRAGILAAGIVADDPASQRIRTAIDYQCDHFEDTPVVVVACYDLGARGRAAQSAGAAIRLLHAVGLRRWLRLLRASRTWIDRSEAASVYPGVENLLLAARSLGLGACLTTWHLFAEDELKAILGIPPAVQTFAVIPIGWPLRPSGPVRRDPVESVIHWNGW